MEIKRELPDWIEGWLQYRDNSEAPTIYNKWVAISMIASVLERKVFLRWDKLIYPNFYIVLVGPPAGGKGVAMGPGRDVLDDMSIRIAADATTKEKLAMRLQEASDDYQSSETGELMSQSAMTIYSEEFTVFLGYGNQEMMPWLCDWYDCKKKWDYQTKHQNDTTVNNLWLNIIGATTPELLQDVLPRESFGSGLNSRIMFIFASGREKMVLFPFAKEGQEELLEKLKNDLQLIRLMRGEYIPSESYLKGWEKWYPAQRNFQLGGDPRMAGYVGRRPTHIHKLAMVINASRDGNLILEEEDLNRAIEYMKEAENRMLQTFAGIGRSSTAPITSAVLSFIRVRGSVRYSEVCEQFKYDANTKELTLVLATLEHAKLIKNEKIEGERDFMVVYIAR